MTPLSWLPLLLLAFSLSGCDFPESPAPTTTKEEPFCKADLECGEEQVCRRGYCAVQTTEPLDLGLTFIPPNSSPYLPQRIAPQPIDATDDLQIGLEASIALRGTISFANTATHGPSGVLVLRRPQAEDNFFTQQLPVHRGAFEAFILAGRYDLAFVPEDATIPRKVWRGKVFTSDTLEELTLPQPRDFLKITGSITHKQPGVLGDGDDRHVTNARVIAVSSQTGNTSTVGLTDEAGNYQIQVLPESGAYTLYVSPGDEDTLIPEVTLVDRFIAEKHNPPPVSVSLGTFASLALPLSVQLGYEGILPDGIPSDFDWSGVTLVFRANIGHGVLTRQATVDEHGKVRLSLLPGNYEVEVLSQGHSPVAHAVHNLDLTNLVDAFAVPVSFKKRVRGIVRDGSGEPLESAKVRFERIMEPSTLNTENRSNSDGAGISVTTTEEGLFELWVEMADYVVSATPLSNSGLPRALIRWPAEEIAAGSQINIDLPAPVVIFGTVYGEDWKSVPDVTVQGFSTLEGRQRVVGEAQTNSQGEFRLIIPSNLD
ncbi:MAG: carboxypeptidase-like regulatory domain-containing protein [Bradymonadaceae bacterium]